MGPGSRIELESWPPQGHRITATPPRLEVGTRAYNTSILYMYLSYIKFSFIELGDTSGIDVIRVSLL